MKPSLLALALTVPFLLNPLSAVAGYQAFDLIAQGQEQVCKVTDGSSKKQCFAVIEGTRQKIDILEVAEAWLEQGPRTEDDNYELHDLKKFGPVILADPDALKEALGEFTVLEVRNIAVDPQNLTLDSERIYVSFVASLRWVGRGGMNGTIHAEGVIDWKEEADLENLKGSIKSFSDSSTAAQMPSLRALENMARAVHFKSVHGAGANTDELTEALLEEILSPAVAYETAIRIQVELIEQLVLGMGEAIGKALGEAIGEAFSSKDSSNAPSPQLP